MKKAIALLILALVLIQCAAMVNPLEGIDIPKPSKAHPFLTFIAGVKIMKQADEAKYPEARELLEQVVATDETFQFPEAYPYLIECYQKLGKSDTTAWIYPLARERFTMHHAMDATLDSTLSSWEAGYPELPTAFTERGFMVMDSGPEPLDGWMGLYRRLEYPEMAKSMSRTGTTWLSFVIWTDGRLMDLQVVKSSSPDLDEAALDVVKNSQFKAAKYRGNPVPYQMVFPIKFAL